MFHSKLEYAVIITLISKFYLLNSEKTFQSTDVVDHGSGSSSKSSFSDPEAMRSF